MVEDRIPHWGEGSLTDTVLVSNRGPLTFHFENDAPVAGADVYKRQGSRPWPP